MKFVNSSFAYHGIFSSYANKRSIQVTLSNNASISYIISDPNTDYFNDDGSIPFFDIDLGDLNILPISYEFSIMKGTSPPTNWSLLGTNDRISWTILDNIAYSNENTTNFCSYYTGGTFHYQCGETVTRKFNINKKKFFNYFRMQIHESRNTKVNQYIYTRHSGIEFYGYYSTNNDFFIWRCPTFQNYYLCNWIFEVFLLIYFE